MIRKDIEAREEAIELYRKIIDVATARPFRKILEDAGEHHDILTSLAKGL